MNIYLSALGWISDAPAGNRLRWHWPFDALTADGHYQGLPEVIIVERAPVERADIFSPRPASVGYPFTWWENLGSPAFAGLLPVHVQTLPRPVQAIFFTWRGLSARVRIWDAEAGRDALDRVVQDGEDVYVEGARMGEIIICALAGILDHLRVLDLFKDRGLHWMTIAEIKVAPTFQTSLPGVADRYAIPPTIAVSEWQDLCDTATEAQGFAPAQAVSGEPTPWNNLAILLGLRWEFALLGGFAFFDGPHPRISPLDVLHSHDLLPAPASGMMACRVHNRDGGRNVASNIAVCPALVAPALTAPASLQYIDPVVHLREDKVTVAPASGSLPVAMQKFVPWAALADEYEVRLKMRWGQTDPHAIGVEIAENVSASPISGAPPEQRQFRSRSFTQEDAPLSGSLARVFDVAFPDVTLTARARAIDAWDRVSPGATATPPTPLILRHNPPAPPFSLAAHDNTNAHLTRALGVTGVPDWAPDSLVLKTGGRVFLYRQIAAPRTATATIGTPMPLGNDLYGASVSGATSLADFIGGTLSVGAFVETVVGVGGGVVQFTAPSNNGSVQLFAAGPVRLTQDLKHPALWTKVTDFSVTGLPSELVFADPLPPTPTGAVESYLARLSYFGRLGPAGNPIRALRQPVPVLIPPPFTVEILGIDFYHRTMLKLRFTTPVSGGRYSVWWAPGNVAPVDMPARGAAGLYGAQESPDGFTLYDVITLPIPQHVDRTVTIGVQGVVNGGCQSDFKTVPIVVPALAP